MLSTGRDDRTPAHFEPGQMDIMLKKKILVTDDSKTVLRILRLALEQGDFEICAVENGLDAYQRFKAGGVDLLLTDLNMPGLDGIGLIRKIRSGLGDRTTPIIMLTTESQESMKNAGRAAGANGWIVKPFKPEQLMQLLNKVLN